MTPAERLRKHQRALEKTQRELDRERIKLENQEKKLIQDIKKSAKNGQMGACKIQAKDLVRTRRCANTPVLFSTLRLLPETNFPTLLFSLHLPPSSSCLLRRLTLLPCPQIHPKVLLHAHPTPSHLPPHPNRALQRTNDAEHERRHLPPGLHEPVHESSRAAAHRHGIRKGERHYGSAAGDDG